MPNRRDVVRIDHAVTVRGMARVAGANVAGAGRLIFDSMSNVTFLSRGNLVVRGMLRMHPDAGVTHTLRFVEVRERRFQGGGMDPIASDVGLWVMGGGRLDAIGTPRTGWLRSRSGLNAGTTHVTLETSPTGWRVGDQIVVVPTSAGDYTGFELRTIAAIEAAGLTLSSALSHDHPAVDGLTPEVANLTRNVRIEGTPSGRSHVFVRASVPQTIKHVAIRHMGPRNRGFVAGRYGLHFHHMRDASRGSLVEGVVIRNAGSHSFVPHASHGITIRDSIAYDVMKDAFWWDRPPFPENNTRSSVWEHLMAAKVGGYGTEDMRVTAFMLGSSGTGGSKEDGTRVGNTGRPFSNFIRDAVAVGVHNPGGKYPNAFHWPDSESEPWEFNTGLVAHNNFAGIFVWSTDPFWHDVESFHAYHNAVNIVHGAYRNIYHFNNIRSFGAQQDGWQMYAVSGDGGNTGGRTMEMNDVSIVNAPNGMRILTHPVPGERRAILRRWTFEGVPRPIIVAEGRSPSPGDYDLHDCTVDGRPLQCSDFTIIEMHPDSSCRVYRNGVLQFTVTPSGCR